MDFKIKITNKEEFKFFIKKLLAVEKFLFIKITDKNVISSVYFPLKDAVKAISVPLSDMFEFDGKIPDKPIKVSFFNGSKIIDALSFLEGDISAIMSCGLSDDGNSYVVDDFKLYDGTSKIKLYIGDPRISFMEMTKDEMAKAFSTNAAVYKFNMNVDDVNKLNSLFKLDDSSTANESKTFRMRIENGKLLVAGQNYDHVLKDKVDILDQGGVTEVYIYRKFIPLLDKESYEVTMCVNKVFLKSNDSAALITFALCAGMEED